MNDETNKVERWPLVPVDDPELPVRRALNVFATSVAGGFVTLFGLAVAPNLIEVRGATPSLQIDRQVRARCLELGVTPAELAELDAASQGSE